MLPPMHLLQGQIRCKFNLLGLKVTTCHHVSGWNILKDDMEIEFRQRRAQSDLKVWYIIFNFTGILLFKTEVLGSLFFWMSSNTEAVSECHFAGQMEWVIVQGVKNLLDMVAS